MLYCTVNVHLTEHLFWLFICVIHLASWYGQQEERRPQSWRLLIYNPENKHVWYTSYINVYHTYERTGRDGNDDDEDGEILYKPHKTTEKTRRELHVSAVTWLRKSMSVQCVVSQGGDATQRRISYVMLIYVVCGRILNIYRPVLGWWPQVSEYIYIYMFVSSAIKNKSVPFRSRSLIAMIASLITNRNWRYRIIPGDNDVHHYMKMIVNDCADSLIVISCNYRCLVPEAVYMYTSEIAHTFCINYVFIVDCGILRGR